jgi:hypothetical protein
MHAWYQWPILKLFKERKGEEIYHFTNLRNYHCYFCHLIVNCTFYCTVHSPLDSIVSIIHIFANHIRYAKKIFMKFFHFFIEWLFFSINCYFCGVKRGVLFALWLLFDKKNFRLFIKAFYFFLFINLNFEFCAFNYCNFFFLQHRFCGFLIIFCFFTFYCNNCFLERMLKSKRDR